ncbi:hypothetical protein TNCV_559181 [Trichonephila clavipes]|nr:hypothetical protein TNCV_559181 [Trichonephila clavipes]
MSSSPVSLKTRRVGQRCTLNLSRAETSSRWCGVVVRRGVLAQVPSSSLDHGSKITWSVAKSPRVAEQIYKGKEQLVANSTGNLARNTTWKERNFPPKEQGAPSGCRLLGLGMVAVGLFILKFHLVRGWSRRFSRCQRLPGRRPKTRPRNILRVHTFIETWSSYPQKKKPTFSCVAGKRHSKHVPFMK